jgi:hypothetical protein
MARNRLRAFSLDTGEPVEIGADVTSFRGQPGILVSVDRPNGPGYEGKVTVRVALDQNPQQYYAGVWRLRVPPEQADAPSNA